MCRAYLAMNRFDTNLSVTGMLNNKSYNDIPIDISKMSVAPTKVIKMTGRQNAGQAPSTAFFHPLHIFCKTNSSLVFAKDLKAGDVIVALQSEVRVEYVDIFDRKSSNWYVLTTKGDSPNAFIDLYLTFPTKTSDLEKYENRLVEQSVEELEYAVPVSNVEEITDFDNTVGQYFDEPDKSIESLFESSSDEEAALLKEINKPTLRNRAGEFVVRA
jgi:hypothetical protein